jgi:hypothetical protein
MREEAAEPPVPPVAFPPPMATAPAVELDLELAIPVPVAVEDCANTGVAAVEISADATSKRIDRDVKTMECSH